MRTIAVRESVSSRESGRAVVSAQRRMVPGVLGVSPRIHLGIAAVWFVAPSVLFSSWNPGMVPGWTRGL